MIKYINLTALLLIVSCSVGSIKRYQPDFTTTRQTSKLQESFNVGNISISEHDFKEYNEYVVTKELLNVNYLQCRMTTFYMPYSMNVKSFIQNSLVRELDSAYKYDQKSKKTINLNIQKINLNSTIGAWEIQVKYKINSKEYLIKTKTQFVSAFSAQAACISASDSFEHALADNFVTLFKSLPQIDNSK